jgi:hypothetical protein
MFGLITSGALLALLLVGTLRRPAVAVAGVLCLYVLKQWGQSSSLLLAEHRTLANFAVAVLAGLAFLLSRRKESPTDVPYLGWGAGAALYLYAFASLVWTPDVRLALPNWLDNAPYILLFAVVMPVLIKDCDDMRSAILWTILVGTALEVLALSSGNWGSRGLVVAGNLADSETNPLALASLAGTIFIMCCLAVPVATTVLKRTMYIALLLVSAAVIMRSGSRGQLVSAVVAAVLAWPFVFRRAALGTALLLPLFAGLIGLAGWLIWQHLGVDSGRWTGAQSAEDAQGRLSMALTLLGAVDNPLSMLFGLGNSAAFHYVGFYPHIAALEVIAEEGVVGAVLYLIMVAATLRLFGATAQAAREVGSDGDRYAVAVAGALFIFELLLTFKEGSWISSYYVVGYAAILARVAGALRSRDPAATVARSVVPDALLYPNLMR